LVGQRVLVTRDVFDGERVLVGVRVAEGPRVLVIRRVAVGQRVSLGRRVTVGQRVEVAARGDDSLAAADRVKKSAAATAPAIRMIKGFFFIRKLSFKHAVTLIL
jgi:UDP-3-O-[3-hydroxymyristoyl] glucosamine N-acyltransferase